MIISWILFSLVAGALISAAAAAADRAAAWLRSPRRWIWIVAMVAAAAWPLVAIVVARVRPIAVQSGDLVPIGSVIRLAERLMLPASTNGATPLLEMVVVALWLSASLFLAGRLLRSRARLSSDSSRWKAAHVDGRFVRVSSNAGPAVVANGNVDIVVPSWVLGLDPSLRAIVLRHEEEHRRARDPLLLQFATLLPILFPWSLPLHWQLRRLRLAVEIDCDARVLRHHPDVRRYGQLLLAMARFRSAAQVAGVALTESTSHLERRIIAMKLAFAKRRWVHALTAIVISGVLVAIACDIEGPTAPSAAEEVADIIDEKPYYAFEVEKTATFRDGPKPPYPRYLRDQRIQGEVLLSVTVDTLGKADMTSLKVLESTHELFTAEIRRVLPRYRFYPAEIRGRKVPSRISLPFEFFLAGD